MVILTIAEHGPRKVPKMAEAPRAQADATPSSGCEWNYPPQSALYQDSEKQCLSYMKLHDVPLIS